MKYVKIKEAAKVTGLHPNTLRKYADNGTIPSKRTPSGQRLFAIAAWLEEDNAPKETICYARVSSRKQAKDLERQVTFLQQSHPEAQVVKDIGSGLNHKRKGLKTILAKVLAGYPLTIVVAHRDRLVRFGFELIEWMVQQNGGKIVVLSEPEQSSPETELVEDLIAIITVFAARVHGLRKYGDRLKKDPVLPH